MIGKFFLDTPIWLLLLITLVILFAAFESGFFLGRFRRKRNPRAGESESPIDPMVAATLGLLAFMLAFTFNVSAQHFSTRRKMVLEEANAIRAVYVKADLLSPAECEDSRSLLRDYIDVRLEVIHSKAEMLKIVEQSHELQARLWDIAENGESDLKGTASAWLYVESLVDMMNKQSTRVSYASHGWIAPSIWVALYWVSILGMTAMGYRAGWAGMRGFIAYMVLILTFSMVTVLISDLDRPNQTLFDVSQRALAQLQQTMDNLVK